MRARRGLAVLGAICGMTALASHARGAPEDAEPPTVTRMVACMVDVLKTTPGVDQIAVSHVNTANMPRSDHPEDIVAWLHPILTYRVTNAAGETQILQFEPQRIGPDAYFFWTILNGLHSPGGPPPSDWGTDGVTAVWKAKCDVGAVGIYT